MNGLKNVALAERNAAPIQQPSMIKSGQESVVESQQATKLSQENIKIMKNEGNYFFLSESQKHENTLQAFLTAKAAGNSPRLKTQVDQSNQLEKVETLEPEEDWNEEFLNRYIEVKKISSKYQEQRESALTYFHKHLSEIDPNYDEGLPIILAVKKNDIEMVKLLLENGANQGLIDALGIAGKNGYIEAAKILITFLKEHDIDFSELRYTTAYSNDGRIKALFDQQFAVTHPNLVKL
jgi:effector-binding domain-containing protein